MKKLILTAVFAVISITSFAQKAKQSPLTAQAYEIAKRVERQGNSNTIESIQQGINEIEQVMVQATDKKDIENITYYRGMTYYNYVRLPFIGDKLGKVKFIEMCKKQSQIWSMPKITDMKTMIRFMWHSKIKRISPSFTKQLNRSI
ncbi:hypothetical protein E5F92_002390 [Flavobacterium columnare]|uniref:hypothetical protein n=1 Tax=Flavobacterium columnare TaxID=996 RepID=UPI002989B01A|nr:hypothetical protein [Flavobacterium columnare]MCH4831599.1 hypothetical protein [Flavobacterium columnare]